MAEGNELAQELGSREIVATRVLDAPRELVWRMWTEPEHIAQWWGSRGFTTTIYEMDVRPEGVWRLVMRGPDGVDYKNRIIFLEVVKPERLVYKHEPERDSEPVSFQVTVTFTEHGGKTKLNMRMLFPSAAARSHVINKYGAIDGLNQTLGRLEEKLAKAGEEKIAAKPGEKKLMITRVLDAPRELVWKMWTEREHLARWWGPRGFTNPVCEVDVRPGGAIRIDMRGPDGRVYPMTGTFKEVDAPERLVFVSSALGEDGRPLFEVLTTVTFADQGDKTTLTLWARVVKTTAAAAPHLAGMNVGWSQSLDRLEEETLSRV